MKRLTETLKTVKIEMNTLRQEQRMETATFKVPIELLERWRIMIGNMAGALEELD